MKRILLVIILMAAPVLAQNTENPNEEIQKLIVLKYADARSVALLLANFNVHPNPDGVMKVIALSGRRANVATAEEAIKQLDIPGAAQKDIDLTVYFVVANSAPSMDPSLASAIPSDLESTVATLKSTFSFKNYGLLDALSLRTRSGVMARTSGQLSKGRLTTFTVSSASVEGDGGMIELKNLQAGLKIPNGVDKNGQNVYLETGINTSVMDVKEGQKLVVGRSSLNGPDTPLFLVLIAKVAQ
jgi:hypothetical protein